MFSGWPFYEPTRCWGDPGYGYHGARCHPCMRPDSNPFYGQWYPGTSYSPFHRHNKCSSPFYRRNPTPFEDADQPCHHQRTRNHVTPESPGRRAKQVATEKCVDKSEKPDDTIDVTAASSTASGDKITNLTPPSTSTKDIPDPTAEAVDSLDRQPPEEAKSYSLPPESEINKIAEIMKKTGELQVKISTYSGVAASKEYIFIEESLVAILLQLDNIDTNGKMEIRKARKSAVCKIQQMLTDLENKAESNMAATETESTKDVDTVMSDEIAETSSDVEQTSSVTTSEQEQMRKSTSNADASGDPSNTIDMLAVVITEETAGTAKLANEHSTVDNVGPSLATDTKEEPAIVGDKRGDVVENGSSSTESMDCTS